MEAVEAVSSESWTASVLGSSSSVLGSLQPPLRIVGDGDVGLDAVVLRLLDAVSLRVVAVVLRVQRGACWWTSWSCC